MVQMRTWRLLLDLDASPMKASYRKIVDGLANAIQSGRLEPGAALPGSRELADLLDVNRKTVMLAYEEAIVKGWLVSEPRRGTFVNTQLQAAQTGRPPAAPAAFAPAILAPLLPPYFD